MAVEHKYRKVRVEPKGHLYQQEEVLICTVIVNGKLPGIDTLGDYFYRCSLCGGGQSLEIREDVAFPEDPCPYPDGITTEILLKVPSGKIIVTDDLRPVYNGFDREGFADYNSSLGQSQVVRAFAEQGCAFGHVLHSPDLFRTGEGTYVFANLPYYENEDDEYETEEIIPKGWTRVAGVCTDLWAYSVADFEDWKSKGGDPDKMSWKDSVVAVPAGTYKFTHHTSERGFDHDGPGLVVFAHIERVEEQVEE